jgi:hypothetical protein
MTAKLEAIMRAGRRWPPGLRLDGLGRPTQWQDPIVLLVPRILATTLRRIQD